MPRWLASVNDKALYTHQILVGDVRAANTPSPIVNTAEDCGFCTAQTALTNDHFAQLLEQRPFWAITRTMTKGRL
jgi:hypothetical protein